MATPIPAAGNGQEKAVVLYKGDAEAVHPLARYGESRVVRIVADRLVLTDNRKNRLNREEALLTAQCAIACQLNPFPPNPELWAWVTVRADGKRDLTLMRGRDGSVKIAMRNAKAQNTYLLSPRFRLVTDVSERERLHIPEGALAFYCTSEDYLSITTWQSMVTTMKDAGVSAEKLLEKAGDPPSDWGIGYVSAEEMENLEWYHDRAGKRIKKLEVKMTHVERAQKRAYMATLRKRWAAYQEPEEVASSLDTDAYIVEGEWMEAPTQEAPEGDKSPEEKAVEEEDAKETLFSPEPPAKPKEWPGDIVDALRDGHILPKDAAARHVIALLALSPFLPGDPIEWIAQWASKYRRTRLVAEQDAVSISPKAAAFQATILWVGELPKDAEPLKDRPMVKEALAQAA
ncbi:MAG: hypothetical protein MUP86_02395, partial [Dehalococcoidia bacterium]|nr:hypothetical protein [Dehalococcoidia bacterium]